MRIQPKTTKLSIEQKKNCFNRFYPDESLHELKTAILKKKKNTYPCIYIKSYKACIYLLSLKRIVIYHLLIIYYICSVVFELRIYHQERQEDNR